MLRKYKIVQFFCHLLRNFSLRCKEWDSRKNVTEGGGGGVQRFKDIIFGICVWLKIIALTT